MYDIVEQMFDFYKRYLKLEETINTVWDNYQVDVNRKESFGDHTLEILFVACLLHKKLAYPISEKLIDMLMISSISEIITGNTVSLIGAGDIEINSASQNSIKQLFESLGEGGEYYYLVWQEYQNGDTATSQYARQIGAFDTLLKARYYEDDTEFERLYDSVYGEYKDMGVFRTGILKNLFLSIKPIAPDVVSALPTFAKEHPHAIIANYDAKYAWGYGFSYNTSNGEFAKFPKYAGEYITFPAMEMYQVIDPTIEEIFILHDKKMFELEKINPMIANSNYRIKKEIKVIPNFYKEYCFEHDSTIRQAQCDVNGLVKIQKQDK